MNNRTREQVYLCLNPGCSEAHNCDRDDLCRSCGAPLQLQERYRAVRLLGQGGFGRTFLAIDQAQTPPAFCVIKQFWSQHLTLLPGDRAKSLFQQEIQRLREFGKHPQIPALLGSFEQDHCFYLVQEYIAGENLAMLLAKREKFSTTEVWHVLESLLPVLQFIHAHHIIHRDIKPENVIVRSPTPHPNLRDLVLVDFGAAKLVTEMTFAQPGTTIGSPEYAAPEQVKGKAVFASDLYSLGVMCIHLLTGMRPFNLFDFASNTWAWRLHWLTDPNSTATQRANQRLAQILDRLIEPALSQRFASAAATIAEIEHFRGEKIQLATPTPELLWECSSTLVGHKGLFANINAITFVADDRWLASASDDKTIRLWDVNAGTELFALQGHLQFVKALAVHASSQTLLSGSCDRTIKLWDLQTKTVLHTLAAHTHHVTAIAVSPDEQFFASGSADKTVKLWNFQTRTPTATLSGHRLAVTAIAFSPIAPLLASASTDTTVQIWNLVTFASVQTLTGHTGAVKAIAFNPAGTLLATGGDDRSIRLWDVTTWQCVRLLSGHPWSISALAFSLDGATLISSSWDKTIKLWQVETGSEIALLIGHTDSISCVAIARDGNLFASGSYDKTIRLWRRCNRD